MTSNQIRFAASLIFGILTVRATSKVLDLRSVFAYAFFYLANSVLNLFLVNDEALDGFRLLVLNIITGFIVPVCLANGQLKVRIVRMGLIELCSFVTEIACTVAYLLITGPNSSVADFSNASPAPIALVYVIGIPTMALSYEVVITACKKRDNSFETPLDANLGPSLVLFNLATYLLITSSMYRVKWRAFDSHALAIALVFLACIGLSFLLSAIVLAVASHDEQFFRNEADRSMRSRHLRHVKSEVASSVKRRLELRRLRHDLSNQLSVVSELTREGSFEEADRYLASLQSQAQDLIGDSHE